MMNSNEEELKRLTVASILCKQKLLFHTKYFFKKLYNRKFVVNSHHEVICSALDLILRGEIVKLILNVAPRYSKTEIAVKNLISNGLAINPASKFIHLSYSDALALDNSEGVKAIVTHESYKQLFPDVQIKYGSDSKKKWYTTAGGGVYATSTSGQVTGFGAGKVDELDDKDFPEYDKDNFSGALIIDDPIKPEDATSDVKREKINQRYESTIKNRVNSRRTPIVIMGQRTHPEDLSGYLMQTDGYTTDIEEAKKDKTKWLVISLPALIDFGLPTERALWEFKHTLEELKAMREADSIVFDTQYQQNPQPKEGLMYSEFRTYNELPVYGTKKSYADTADKGKDYLAQASYIETDEAIYITDLIYTTLGMEDTEPMSAKQIVKENVELARFEGNNGGEGFSRAVEGMVRRMGNHICKFETFHQSNNKEVRIFNNSAKVTNLIYMPSDWKTRWPLAYSLVKTQMTIFKIA
jgi:predicted phage terminase large subunit-like protein